MDDDALENGSQTIAVSAAVLSLATIFASGRIFCRIRMLDFLYADDWIIVLSLVCPHIEAGRHETFCFANLYLIGEQLIRSRVG